MEAQNPNQSTAPAPDEELRKQYEELCRTVDYFGITVIGVMLSYYVLDAQKKQLYAVLTGCAENLEEVDFFPIQLTSIMITIDALVYFVEVSQAALETQSTTDKVLKETQEISFLSNMILLISASLKLYSLLLVEFSPEPQTEQQVVEEEIETAFPL